jgi:hypothetical protein
MSTGARTLTLAALLLERKSVAKGVKALISIAHPVREALEREAREHQLVPRTFW